MTNYFSYIFFLFILAIINNASKKKFVKSNFFTQFCVYSFVFCFFIHEWHHCLLENFIKLLYCQSKNNYMCVTKHMRHYFCLFLPKIRWLMCNTWHNFINRFSLSDFASCAMLKLIDNQKTKKKTILLPNKGHKSCSHYKKNIWRKFSRELQPYRRAKLQYQFADIFNDSQNRRYSWRQ